MPALDKCFLKNNAKIYMFHSLKNNEKNFTLNDFSDFLKKIKKDNIEIVSIDEALEKLHEGQKKGYCVLTFDDGFEDIFNDIYPLLKEEKIPFVMYITTDFIGQKGYLSKKSIDVLKNEKLCTIGSHTKSHSMLRYNENAFEDIIQGKRELESIIEKRVRHFAYPYGSVYACSLKNLKEVKRTGFESAVSTFPISLNVLCSKNKFYLPRIDGEKLIFKKIREEKNI